MKNFDELRVHRSERDRSFQIGGETFTYRPSVAPEVMASWNEAVTGEVALGEREWLKLYDATILGLLESGQEEKWAAVRAPGVALPINLADLSTLMEWLLAEQSGRPTERPSDSTQTDGPTGTESTDTSSPPLVAVPAT